MANVCVSLAGISLRNPTVLVAGIMGTNAELLCRVGKCGAGAVTGISCSLEPRSGAVNPCLLELGGALLNCVGLANPGVEAYCIELSKAVGASDVPVFGSVAGSSVEEFGLLAERVAAAGVVAVELNLGAHSCFGRRVWNLEEIGKVVEGVKSRVKKPVFVKLAPSLGLVDNAMVAEAAGADAITAVHSFGPGMVIDVESGTPVLSSRAGGMSGPAIKPLALKCVYDVCSSVEIPVIGTGGVSTGRDALEMIMAGATAVGIGSGVYYRGASVFSRVENEIKSFMNARGFSSLEEIRGLALK